MTVFCCNGYLTPEKNKYCKNSKEIKGNKIGSRFWFKKSDLDFWKELKEQRTVILTLKEYEKCFEFAIKMAYSARGSHGTGIRGARSEVQMADDFILGILAEHGIQKFIKEKFNIDVELDTEVHPDHITEQDFIGIKERNSIRPIRINVAVKASKWKNCFNIIDPLEYENPRRRSDIYIFVRVGLPSDHLFRILREHSFFKNVKDFLENSEGFKKIKELREIPIWVTGFSYHNELEKVREIPGQRFDNGYRYVKAVGQMHNSNDDWKDLVKKL